jgi:hypothetical protein
MRVYEKLNLFNYKIFLSIIKFFHSLYVTDILRFRMLFMNRIYFINALNSFNTNTI